MKHTRSIAFFLLWIMLAWLTVQSISNGSVCVFQVFVSVSILCVCELIKTLLSIHIFLKIKFKRSILQYQIIFSFSYLFLALFCSITLLDQSLGSLPQLHNLQVSKSETACFVIFLLECCRTKTPYIPFWNAYIFTIF